MLLNLGFRECNDCFLKTSKLSISGFSSHQVCYTVKISLVFPECVMIDATLTNLITNYYTFFFLINWSEDQHLLRDGSNTTVFIKYLGSKKCILD